MIKINPSLIWEQAIELTLRKASFQFEEAIGYCIYGEEYAGQEYIGAIVKGSPWCAELWCIHEDSGKVHMIETHGFDLSMSDFFVTKVKMKAGTILDEPEDILAFLLEFEVKETEQ